MIRSLFCFAFAMLLSVSNLTAQKKTPREISGKNVRNTLERLIRPANILKEKKKPPCNFMQLMRSIDRSKLVPTEKEAAKVVDNIIDSMSIPKDYFHNKNDQYASLEIALESKNFLQFIPKLTKTDLGNIRESYRQTLRKKFNYIKELTKNGQTIFEKTITSGVCKIKVETRLKAKSIKRGYKKNKTLAMTVNWELKSKLVIDCECTAKNKHRVKNTVVVFEAASTGPLRFNIIGRRYNANTGNLDKFEKETFGLRFGKLIKPVGRRSQLFCCKENENSEDGSYVDPNEPVRYDNTFINTGIGLAFVNDADTQLTGSAGLLFPVTYIGDDPLFVGGQFGINTTSISSDLVTNEFRIGPIAEYDVSVNEKGLEWIVGLFSGYLFGDSDLGEFDQEFDGFFASLYTGLDIPISDKVTLAILASFLEYQSLNLTIDATGEEQNFDSGISFDRIGLSTGLRINLD